MAYTTPIPGVAQQGMAANAAKLAYDKALARIGQKRSSLLRQHGYTGTFDDKGNLSGMQVDAHNPYGLYQQNRRANALAGEQMRSQVQSRGIAGGLAKQFENRGRYAWGMNDAQQGQHLLGGVSDLVGEQDEAYGQYNNTLWQEQLENARNAIMQQAFNQADYSSLEYPNYGDWQESTVPPVASPVLPTSRTTGAAGQQYGANSFYQPVAPKPKAKAGASGAEIMRINNAIKAAKPKKKGGK